MKLSHKETFSFMSMKNIRESGNSCSGTQEAVLHALFEEWMNAMDTDAYTSVLTDSPTKTRWVIAEQVSSGTVQQFHSSPGEVNSYIFKRHQFLKHQGYSDLDRAASTVVQSGKVQLRKDGDWVDDDHAPCVGFPGSLQHWAVGSAFQIHSWTPIHSRILILQKYHMKCVLV